MIEAEHENSSFITHAPLSFYTYAILLSYPTPPLSYATGNNSMPRVHHSAHGQLVAQIFSTLPLSCMLKTNKITRTFE